MRRTQTFSNTELLAQARRWLAERRDVLEHIEIAVHDVDGAFTGVILEVR